VRNLTEPGVSAKYIEKASQIAMAAEKERIPLKLMGCVAVKVHSPKWSEFHENMMQRHATDLDFMTLSKYRGKVTSMLESLGYHPMRTTTPREDRLIYLDNEDMHVDVFFDKLSMCHVIDFKNRLEIDPRTISLSDIMLEKLQIVKINEKDIKDVMILLREHDIGTHESETINADYIAKLFSNDWGFYYTATVNLKLIKDKLNENSYQSIFKKEDVEDIADKIDKLLNTIENEPKSTAWKMRARTGPKKRWYEEVEEVHIGGEFESELAKLMKGG
jgi:hypothetical protein